MIKSLHIQNFQSHKDTRLEFSNGVNIIGGQSDSGKTAILRALRWVCTNRPSGDAFRSNWGGDTSVAIEVSGHKGITRKKTKGLNGYDMGTQTFVALGTEVPEPIVDALNISPLSWQSQMDAPFLLSESAGEVSKILNEVADLEKIDVALSNVNRMIRDNKTDLFRTENTISEQSEIMKQFDGVDEQKKKIVQLKVTDQKASLIESMVSKGRDLLRKHEAHSATLANTHDVEKLETVVDRLHSEITKLDRIEERILKTQDMIQEHESLTVSLNKFKNIDSASKRIESLLKQDQDLFQMWQGIDQIQEGLKRITTCTKVLDGCKRMLSSLETEWKESFPSECPLCGQEVKDDKNN